ncbi:DUF192 domain-containing protein [Rhodohalobacter sp. 8-1]|uniref:DUF192 domain-containing protein n=1 Tax=Rhodohalobacter sp. 8-1 TaxID=3131972 RepID=UPI0030EC3D6E
MISKNYLKSKIGCLFMFITSVILMNCSGADRQAQQQAPQDQRTLNYEAKVAFISNAGDTLSTIEVAVADDQESRTQGLMNVNSMPENAGMLFIFEENQPRSFWMASTPLSLDLIFANEDFEIVRIHRNASPYSQDSISSEEPAKYVVEVNAGYTLEHDINEGASIAILE